MAAGCALDGVIIIPMDGPAQLLALGAFKTPDEALGPGGTACVAAVAACAVFDQQTTVATCGD